MLTKLAMKSVSVVVFAAFTMAVASSASASGDPVLSSNKGYRSNQGYRDTTVSTRAYGLGYRNGRRLNPIDDDLCVLPSTGCSNEYRPGAQ